jgi:ribosomal protein S18 acetylase RimI-like enzyme
MSTSSHTTGVAVREVAPDELGDLGRLTREAYVALGRPLPESYLRELEDVASRAAAALVLVAVSGSEPDDRELLGGVTYVDDPANPFAEFDDPSAAGFRMLAVAPSAQRRGVGEALVDACIVRARSAAKTRLVLHSATWMVGAHRLYRRMGFHRATELDWSPAPDVDLWGFALDLVP